MLAACSVLHWAVNNVGRATTWVQGSASSVHLPMLDVPCAPVRPVWTVAVATSWMGARAHPAASLVCSALHPLTAWSATPTSSSTGLYVSPVQIGA